MTRTSYKTLTALLWSAPVAIVIRYRQLWDRLPLRMATHFNVQGQPNGWMTRETSLYYSAGFLAFLAALFCVIALVIEKKYPQAKVSWMLAFFHAEIWTFVCLQNSLLEYNLDRTPIAIPVLPIVSVIAVLVMVAVVLGEKRGTPLSPTDVLAEEVHSGKPWAAIFLLPSIALIATASAIPGATPRIAMIAISVIMIAVFAMSWDGFHYYFSRHGIEIRTLGFRLKSIPLLQIRSYEIQSWNPIRGYGIRGVGNCKAYVWGKTGVRVDMYDGQVFLGHSDPQRIVHDLNVIKRFQTS
jgi:Protein of unknown function (DUF1648)